MAASVLRKGPPQLRLVPKEGWAGPPSEQRAAVAPAFDDAELLASVRNGDVGSAAAFHDRVRPQVDRTISRLLGRGDNDHDDVAQLALMELIYTIDNYRGECSLDTWTSTLTAHIVYKHIRRRQTERRLFAQIFDADELPVASRHATGREAIGRSAMRRIAHHLYAIDPKQAWAFVLHDTLGYDLREVAQITGVSVAAAQTRLIRGRRELHQRIAQDPELANTLEEMENSR